MEAVIQELDSLLAKKKKKGAFNAKARDSYAALWLDLVKAEGFSPRVEDYFYKGISICGSKALKKYVVEANEPKEALQEFFRGKEYGKDRVTTFRAVVSLAAELLIDSNADIQLFGLVIRYLPSASLSKDNKIMELAGNIVLQYFVRVITSDMELRPLSSVPAAGAVIKDFVELFDTALQKADQSHLKKIEEKDLIKINAWLHEKSETASESKDSIKSGNVLTQSMGDTPEKADKKEKHQANMTQSDVAVKKIAKEEPVESIHKDIDEKRETGSEKGQTLQSILQMALDVAIKDEAQRRAEKSEAETVLKRYQNLEAQFAELENEHKKSQAELEHKNSLLEDLQKTLKARQDDIAEFKLINLDQEKLIKELRETVADRDKELSEKAVLVEALNAEGQRKLNESYNRIASSLRTYYLDFMEAESMEMSVDLGENMRDSLRDVFKILAKAGIVLK